MSSSQDEDSSAWCQSGHMGKDSMSRLHGHLLLFSLMDCILLLVLLMGGFGATGSAITLFALLAALLLVPLGVVSMILLHRKSAGGINVGIANFSLTGSLFLILGVLGLISYANSNDGSFLLPVALTLLGVSTLRRVSTMRNEAYSAWYHSHITSDLYDGEESEILSTCPNCNSILAVVPSRMSTDDICPNCGSKLVTMS